MTAEQKLYAIGKRECWKLGEHYTRHSLAMESEGLHMKSDIAAELAVRDAEIEHLRAEVASWKGVAHDHSERLKKLDQRLTACSEMLLRHACYCGSKSRDVNMHGEQCPYRRAFDVKGES